MKLEPEIKREFPEVTEQFLKLWKERPLTILVYVYVHVGTAVNEDRQWKEKMVNTALSILYSG